MAGLQGGCRLQKDKIIGWARDPKSPDTVNIVVETVDGIPVWSGPANLFRPDLKEKSIGDGKNGFSIPIPSVLIDREIAVHIRQPETAAEVPGSPILLTEEFWRTYKNSLTALQGACRLRKGRIIGWAHDPKLAGAVRIVAETEEGHPVWQGSANLFRPDLKEKGIGDGSCGFSFSVPSALFDRDVAVHIRQSGTATEIPGSPIKLTEEFWSYRRLLSSKMGLPFFGVVGDVVSDGDIRIFGYALPPESAKPREYGFYINGIQVDSLSANSHDLPVIGDAQRILWFVPGYEDLGFKLELSTEQHAFVDSADGVELIKIGFGRSAEDAMDPLRVVYVPIFANDEIRVADNARRARVQGPDASHTNFVTLGYSHYRYYRQVFEQYSGKRWQDVRCLVDWGCGCGRVSQYLIRSLPDNRVTGIDIDRDNIKWCRENLSRGDFHVGPLYPPTHLQDSSVDYLVATSVFTHLIEETQKAWLEEIHRVLKPGALTALTVATDCRVAWGSFDSAWLENLEEKGIDDVVVSHDLDGHLDEQGYYRNVRMTKDYIRGKWSRWFEIVAILDHVFAYQDVVVCRKKPV